MLRDRRLLALLVAETVSTTGSQMTWLALPWFVLVTTGSAGRMAIVVAVEAAGVALFGLPGGSALARLGARRTMMLCDAARAPLVLAVPLLHWAGALSYPLLLVLVFASGAFFGPYFAAQRVVVPELLGEDEALVGRANALLQGATRITLLLGPALAGLLIGVIGAAAVLLIDAATYFVSFALVAGFVPGSPRVAEVDDSRGVLAGIRHIMRDPLLRAWGIGVVIVDASWMVLFVSLPVLVYEDLGRHASTAGWLFAAFGAGAVLGNIVAYRRLERVDPLLWASIGLLIESVPLWLLPLPVSAVVVGGAMLAAGVINGLVNPALHSILTLRAPATVRAKVMTAVLTLSAAGSPFALLVAAPALGSLGPRFVLGIVAATQTVVRILGAVTGLRIRRTAEPALAGS